MKIKNIILFAILFILLFAIGILAYSYTHLVEEELEEYSFTWCSNYIWNNSADKNTWMRFRKKIYIEDEKDLRRVIAQISADSKYWLYINGEMVIREGSLKRGEDRNSIYYDQIDISEYLHVGENTIAAIVWYWGSSNLSYNPSGQGAFAFQTKIGESYVISDSSWKVSVDPAYMQDPLRPNYRIAEYNVYYSAKDEDAAWYAVDYDDSSWEDALSLAPVGNPAWGKLIERSIPQFKNSKDIVEYLNTNEYKDYLVEENTVLKMAINENVQLMPYLKIEAPEDDMKITIKTDMYGDVNGDSIMYTYFTKKGVQEFEGLPWIHGENVLYEIPAGIKVIELGYRKTGYDTKFTGMFESNDEFLNSLWEKARNSVYVNMRDSYMDCPNRERAQWLADMNIEMLSSMYAFDTNANALYEKGIRTVIGWESDKVIGTVAPIDGNYVNIPAQNLAGVATVYEYYKYTKNKELIEEIYPVLKDYLSLWSIDPATGYATLTKTDYAWRWGDSVAESDYDGILMTWYYLALDNLNKLAKELEYEEDHAKFTEDLKILNQNIESHWTEKGYTYTDGFIDERTNSLAVISGIASEDKYETIKNILVTDYQTTPYMEYYVLEALCKMGYIKEAENRMKDRYFVMVDGPEACSTLWEHWFTESGTKTHGWGAGPLIILSKYFAGIQPLENGYEEVLIKPTLGTLNKISSNTTTVKGDITLNAERKDGKTIININTPVDGRIGIEKNGSVSRILVDGKLIFEDGLKSKTEFVEFHSEDEGYVYFTMKAGCYNFVSE